MGFALFMCRRGGSAMTAFGPGRKHSLLPALATNVPLARLLNASRPFRKGASYAVKAGQISHCGAPVLCRTLRADEGIGPYDRRRRLRTVGVDPQIDPQRCRVGNVNIKAKCAFIP